jgi:uroporphyrinogen-III synthase
MTKVDTSLLGIVHLLGDLVVFESYSFDEFLRKLIILVNKVIPVDSCLIYFFDKGRKELTLCASKRSHEDLMGKITMRKGEGITGWVAEHGTPVVLKEGAFRDERFKPFSELPEDAYEAFLSMPIKNKDGVVGVVNLQHRQAYDFSDEEIAALEAIVKIIASGFEKVVLSRKVGDLESKLEERKVVERAKGLLMKKDGIPEKKAFDLIRNEAMKKRKSMKEIAEAIILLYG